MMGLFTSKSSLDANSDNAGRIARTNAFECAGSSVTLTRLFDCAALANFGGSRHALSTHTFNAVRDLSLAFTSTSAA